jgi:2,4-dienoyl-CoA reductase-like NADH-dependent reductase (Old Yellow Enzyme family)
MPNPNAQQWPHAILFEEPKIGQLTLKNRIASA